MFFRNFVELLDLEAKQCPISGIVVKFLFRTKDFEFKGVQCSFADYIYCALLF